MSCRSSHVIKLKLSSQLIGQFGHVTASASCKQPEKHGMQGSVVLDYNTWVGLTEFSYARVQCSVVLAYNTPG